MASGHPDWSPIVATTIEHRETWSLPYSTGGSTTTTIWTPPAGERIRLVQYHVCLSIETHPNVGSGATIEVQVTLENQDTGEDIDRWGARVECSSTTSNAVAVDSGLCVLGGGGLSLPVDDRLAIVVARSITNTGTALVSGGVGGMEE